MKYSRNSLLLTAGLFAIAAAIVFHAWWPVYKQHDRGSMNEQRRNVESEQPKQATKNELLAACVEMSETSNADGAQRIRILREIGMPADQLDATNSVLELYFAITMDMDDCVGMIERRLRGSE